MIRKGLIAAALTIGLLLSAGLVLTASAHGGREKLVHTCSAVDKKFINTATLNMLAVGTSGRDYMAGDENAERVIDQAESAARLVGRAKPTDPALQKARALIAAMLNEYGRAIQAREDKRDSGVHMYRAYGLASFASDVLRSAQAELSARGCDVSPLL